jgi:hypothetical protein
VPLPVNTDPLQQKRYSPVSVFHISTVVGLLSSCKQALNTPTVNVQLAWLPAPSVAVQLTVVVPTLKVDPDGGTHIEVTPGQLSVTVGGG